MNILDLVVGKPIKTTDERAEQIGPAQGVPIFGLDGLSSAAYGPEAALEPSDSTRPAGGSLYRSRQRCNHRAAGDCVFFVSPDHRRLSLGRRFLYRCSIQSRVVRWTARRRCAACRLHSYGCGGYLGGSGCTDLGGAVAAAAHGFSFVWES